MCVFVIQDGFEKKKKKLKMIYQGKNDKKSKKSDMKVRECCDNFDRLKIYFK